MGKQFEKLSEQHIDFIQQQQMFFVGTAAETGKVNISPKGMDSLRVLSSNKVAWLNVTGSGNETAAHIQQSSRMTLMFCAFEGKPNIMRLYGTAEVLHCADPAWSEYIELFPEYVSARQIFIQTIDMVQTSCGFSVPFFDYVGERETLGDWAKKKGRDGIEQYWKDNNQNSLDGFETNVLKLSGVKE